MHGHMNLNFRKYVEEILVSLKSDKKTGTLYEELCTFMTYLAQFFLNEKCFGQMLYRKLKHPFCFNNVFPRIVPFLLMIMWKNMVQTDRPQVAIQHGAEKMWFVCRINKTKIHTHTLSICNTHYCYQQYEIFCSRTSVQREPILVFPTTKTFTLLISTTTTIKT
jgi:hypothetical protein